MSHAIDDWDRRTLSYDSACVEDNDDEDDDENDNGDNAAAASSPPKHNMITNEEDGTTPHSHHYFPAHLFPEYDNQNLPRDNDYPLMCSTNDDHDDETKLYNDDELFNALAAARLHGSYRKCSSEVGTGSTPRLDGAGGAGQRRSSVPKLPRIGILQADGIVYNDALLLKLANTQATSSRCTDRVTGVKDFTFIPDSKEININNNTKSASTNNKDRRYYNHVKIHIYDLLTTDSLVEVPYLNCNFPIGQCLKGMNDGCQVLGTGIYHVGVEVNGVEYAFGANDTAGMSGVFTCTPKESPGYEYRETLDFGRVHTTKRTWIRVPTTDKTNSSSNRNRAATTTTTSGDETLTTTLLSSSLSDNEKKKTNKNLSSTKTKYSFHEIESFADGHSIILSMAREYMGTDYDLLRKNCCTFAHEVCTRHGVHESAIPTYFHNAAQAGAHAEDVVNNVENSVRNILSCTAAITSLDGITPSTAPTLTKIDDRIGSRDYGYEVILGSNKDDVNASTTTMSLCHTVVESSAMRTPHQTRQYIDLTSAVSDEVDF